MPTKAKPYKFLKNSVTADITFEATGKNLNELFKNCALALMDTMVDMKSVKSKFKKPIRLRAKDESTLLINFLNEIVYYKDAESMLISSFKVDIKKKEDAYLLTAELSGEPLQMGKHLLRSDVKAATWHNFKLEKKGANYIAQVVLDI
ncbi:MAG: archease [DPANN group archaeon]|nr:archease [DPANN group archaeon]